MHDAATDAPVVDVVAESADDKRFIVATVPAATLAESMANSDKTDSNMSTAEVISSDSTQEVDP
jgi:hypothetical protein